MSGVPRMQIPAALKEQFCVNPMIGQPLMSGMFLLILRQHFLDASTFFFPSLAISGNEVVWSPGPGTRLTIETVTRFEPRQASKRPALVVIPGPQQPGPRLSIGGKLHGPIAQDGDDRYTRLWTGSHTIMAISPSGSEAMMLALEAGRYLGAFCEKIRAAFDLMRVAPAGIGKLGRLEEARECWAVPVEMAYAYQESWLVKADAPLLTELKVDLTAVVDAGI